MATAWRAWNQEENRYADVWQGRFESPYLTTNAQTTTGSTSETTNTFWQESNFYRYFQEYLDSGTIDFDVGERTRCNNLQLLGLLHGRKPGELKKRIDKINKLNRYHKISRLYMGAEF